MIGSSSNQKGSRYTVAFICVGLLFFLIFELKPPAVDYESLKGSLTFKNKDDDSHNGKDGGDAGGPGMVFDDQMFNDSSPTHELQEIETGIITEDNHQIITIEPHATAADLIAQSSKVAVIVENRPLNNLIPLLLHFAAVLGPTWPVVLYTSPEHVDEFITAPALVRMQHQIETRSLPRDILFNTHDSVSVFLTKSWLWEHLAPAKHVLMFQADSVLCANSDATPDDFLQYDFIGAPIKDGNGRGYNGGLSIRNREKCLHITKEFNWEAEWQFMSDTQGYNPHFEDQWFALRLSRMPHTRLPAVDVAKEFSVETIWAERPVGYHQIARWQKDRMKEVEEWCPEVRLTIGPTFI